MIIDISTTLCNAWDSDLDETYMLCDVEGRSTFVGLSLFVAQVGSECANPPPLTRGENPSTSRPPFLLQSLAPHSHDTHTALFRRTPLLLGVLLNDLFGIVRA